MSAFLSNNIHNFATMKKKQYNTVEVKVGSFIRDWVLATYKSDLVKIDKYSNLWGLIKNSLDTLPNDYRPLTDKSEYISFVLLANGKDTIAYNRVKDKIYQPNTLYRCYINEENTARIVKYFENQFKAAFHTYMIGAVGNNDEMTIVEGISSFMIDFNLQDHLDKKMLSRLQKDWYRYRQKCDDGYPIPMFF